MSCEDEGEMPASLHRSPAAEPTEDDDLLSEILLRLPPQPSSLPRASLVSKRWRRLVSDRGFFRRFRLHHRRNPPILGLLDRYHCMSFVPILEPPNRVPPGRFSLQRDVADCSISLGCRHGLVLIYFPEHHQVMVWDPFTGDQHRIALPPRFTAKRTKVNGAVLRAAGGVHFQVVVVVADDDDDNRKRAFASVYSSESGVWGGLVSTPIPSGVNPNLSSTYIREEAAVLIGGSLYWLLLGNFTGILEFDLDRQRLAAIRMPVDISKQDNFTITRTEGGELGLLCLAHFSAQLWNRKTHHNGIAAWVLGRTIEVDKLLCLNPEARGLLSIIGYAEYNNVVFMWTLSGIFMTQLQSLQVKKLPETDIMVCYPFESVYAAGTSNA